MSVYQFTGSAPKTSPNDRGQRPSDGGLVHLVYASRPFGFDDLALSGILATARRNNARDGITGALICREDVFLQWLEGPEDAIAATFARIERDDRHTEIRCFFSDPLDQRVFPDWAMRHDPPQSWMWSPEQIAAGFLAEATADDARAIFLRLASVDHSSAIEAASTGCPIGRRANGNGHGETDPDPA